MVAALRQPAAANHVTATAPAPRGEVRRPARYSRRTLSRLWRCLVATDNYALVLLLIVVSSVVAALADRAPFPIPMPILFGGTLLYALRTSGVSRRARMLAAMFVIGGVGLAIGSAVVTGRIGPGSVIDSGVACLLVVVTLAAVVRRLVQHPAVSASTLAGAVCIYLLVGLFFAFFFGLMSAIWSDPFFASRPNPGAFSFLYFSLSTLTTLGYGDLVPGTDLGRMLAVTEALFGQMYPVTVVALLVSNFGRERHHPEA